MVRGNSGGGILATTVNLSREPGYTIRGLFIFAWLTATRQEIKTNSERFVAVEDCTMYYLQTKKKCGKI